MKAALALVLLACVLRSPARAASDNDDDAASDSAPAAATAKPVFPPRPEHAVIGDTNSDGATVLRGKGGPDTPSVHGGAVIVDADGNRLEIAPSKRPAPEESALAAPAGAVPVKLKLPVPPVLDDPKAPLELRRQRAQDLLGATAAAAVLLFLWARRRWRPDV